MGYDLTEKAVPTVNRDTCAGWRIMRPNLR